MTSRNLNTTWRDRLFRAYKEDYEADAPFPIRYLIQNERFKQDLWYEVATKIHPDDVRRSFFASHKATKDKEDPEYEDANIKVHRKRAVGQDSTVETLPTQQNDDQLEEPGPIDAPSSSLASS